MQKNTVQLIMLWVINISFYSILPEYYSTCWSPVDSLHSLSESNSNWLTGITVSPLLKSVFPLYFLQQASVLVLYILPFFVMSLRLWPYHFSKIVLEVMRYIIMDFDVVVQPRAPAADLIPDMWSYPCFCKESK